MRVYEGVRKPCKGLEYAGLKSFATSFSDLDSSQTSKIIWPPTVTLFLMIDTVPLPVGLWS